MYNKLMLKNGDILSDVHLNHIENGVVEVERSANQFKKTIAKIVTAKGVPAYETDSFDTLSNKIKTIEIVKNELNLSDEEIYTIGDGPNDLDMIKFARIGVAMANGDEHIKQAADIITESCDNFGAAVILEKLIEKGEFWWAF